MEGRVLPTFGKNMCASFVSRKAKDSEKLNPPDDIIHPEGGYPTRIYSSPQNIDENHYLEGLLTLELSYEEKLIKLLQQLDIHATKKSEPHSLPYNEEIIITLRGETWMAAAFEFKKVARKIVQELLIKDFNKVRFYMHINALDNGFLNFGSMEYRFRYYNPYK